MADLTAIPTDDLGRRPEPMTERVVVRCYPTFHDAKRAVDQLTFQRIPGRRITVLGRGLRWREPFSAGRLLKAASLGGALLAAAVAAFLWAAGGLDASFSALSATVAGGLLGAAFGAVLGGIAWFTTRRDRAVPETGAVDVDRYDVLVELESAERARAVLEDATSAG